MLHTISHIRFLVVVIDVFVVVVVVRLHIVLAHTYLFSGMM